jgi:hypothetical protein
VLLEAFVRLTAGVEHDVHDKLIGHSDGAAGREPSRIDVARGSFSLDT